MKIINRTPHPISITPSGTASEAVTITIHAAPRGEVARVETTSRVVDSLWVEAASQDPAATNGKAEMAIPIAATSWGRVVGLPTPSVHFKHVVSVIVAAAAHAEGRDIADLYVPGDQVRDASGRIVGCMALTPAEFALPGDMLRWSPGNAIARLEDVAALLCYSDDVGDGEQRMASRRRGRWPLQAHFIVRRCERDGGGYVRVAQEWGTDAWSWTDITADQAVLEYVMTPASAG